MTDIVISIKNLSKRYTLNQPISKRQGYETIQDSLIRLPQNLIKYTKQLTFQLKHKQPLNPLSDFWALNNVSIEIRNGERVGLIGRNGAGKSTLLKILSRITEPSEGEILIRGRVASLLEVGTGFHPELTGRENIYLSGAILGMTKYQVERNFTSIVEFAEVEKFLDTPVKRYSSGMYVRLAFAVAAHLESDILLIDEVLAVGDSRFQKKCIEKMREISESNRTIIFVSHQSDAIRKFCHKAIWLDKGSVVAIGDANAVVDEYEKANLYQNSSSSGIFIRDKNKLKNNSGNVYISKVSLKASGMIDCYGTSYKFGDLLDIEVELNDGLKIEPGCYLIWSLRNESGQLISSGDTSSAGVLLDVNSSTIICHLGPLPLYRRRYYLEFGVGVAGMERFDTWSDEVFFDIYSADPHGTGASFDGNSGSVYLEHVWSLKQ